MAPMTAGPAPVRNAWTAPLVRSWSKRGPPTRTKRNEGANATNAARRPPPSPAGGVADDRHGLDHGTGRDLPEGDGVEELGARS